MLHFFRSFSTLFFIVAVLVDSSAYAATDSVELPVQVEGELVPLTVMSDAHGFKVKRADHLKTLFGRSRVEMPMISNGAYRVHDLFTLENRFFVLLQERAQMQPDHYELAEFRFTVFKPERMSDSTLLPVTVMTYLGAGLAASVLGYEGIPRDPVDIALLGGSVAAAVVGVKVWFQEIFRKHQLDDQKIVLDRIEWIKGGHKNSAHEIFVKRNEDGLIDDVIIQPNANVLDRYSLRKTLRKQSCGNTLAEPAE